MNTSEYKKNLEGRFEKDFGTPYFPILADLYMDEEDYRRAKLVCNVGLEYDPSNSFGKYILAKIAIIEEKPAVAEKWLKKVIHENPANFPAFRLLIKIELLLNRSHNTIRKYLDHVLKYIPNDPECLKLIDKQKITLNSTPDLKKQPVIKTKANSGSNKPDLMNNISITKNDNYQLEESMATFSMVSVLKSQKHYQQALAILKTLETTKADLKRIHKERSEIKLLIKKTLIQ